MLKNYFLLFSLIFFFSKFQIEAQNTVTSCPDGALVTSDNFCFQIVNDYVTFNDAENYCVSIGGHLAVINNGFTNIFLTQHTHDFDTQDFWIGARAYKNNSCQTWAWTDNNQFVTFNDFSYTDACGDVESQCVAVSISRGTWSGVDCSASKPYFCSVPHVITYCPGDWIYYNVTKSCYKTLYSDNWQNAENNCVAQNAHLTSIHGDAENNFIINIARSGYADHINSLSAGTWIGLHTDDSNNYVWTDGTPFDYRHWAPDEPSQQRCGSLVAETLGSPNSAYSHLFANFDCSSVLRNYVCKKAATTLGVAS